MATYLMNMWKMIYSISRPCEVNVILLFTSPSIYCPPHQKDESHLSVLSSSKKQIH